MLSNPPNLLAQQKQKNLSNKLSKRILELIFEFLDSDSQNNLAQTCKNYYNIYKGNSYFMAKNCLQKYFTIDIEYFIECGDNPDYLKEKFLKDEKIYRQTQFSDFYKQISQKQLQIDIQWKNIIEKLDSNKENNLNPIDYSHEIKNNLRDPPLPIINLKRENIGVHCQTQLQNDLAEMLYCKGPGFAGFDQFQDQSLIQEVSKVFLQNKDNLIQEAQQFCQESAQNKQTFLKLRWYIIEEQFQLNLSQKHIKLNEESQNSFHDLDLNLNLNLAQKTDTSQELFELKELDNLSLQKSVSTENKQIKEKEKEINLFPTLISDSQPQQQQQQQQDLGLVESGPLSQPIFKQEQGEQKVFPVIMQFYIILFQQLDLYSNVISHYFLEHQLAHQNAYDLLSEYNLKWTTYVACLHEMEDNLKDYFSVFNSTYEAIFPEYPSFPKLNLWRMMGKLWIKNVYQNNYLQNHLFESFLKILTKRRKDNLQFQINQGKLDEKLENAYYMPQKLDQISIMMVNSFTKSKKFSFKQQTISAQYAIDHNYYSKDYFQVDQLLANFVESIMDISLNEINVHYLGHTQVQVEQPYMDLEQAFLQNCQEFYKYQHQQLFASENLQVFFEFLEGDIKYLSKIFKERTLNKLRKIQLEIWLEMFENKLEGQFLEEINNQNCQLSFSKISQQTNNNNNNSTDLQLPEYIPIPNMMTSGVQSSNLTTEKKQKKPEKNETTKEIEDQLYKIYFSLMKKSFCDSVSDIDGLITDYAQKLLKEEDFQEELNFKQLIQKEKDQIGVSKCDQDREIEELNLWRKIPKNLNQIECLFYSLNGQVCLNHIEKLVSEKKAKDNIDSDSDQSKYSEYHSNQGEKITQSKQLQSQLPEMISEDSEEDSLPEFLPLNKSASHQIPQKSFEMNPQSMSLSKNHGTKLEENSENNIQQINNQKILSNQLSISDCSDKGIKTEQNCLNDNISKMKFLNKDIEKQDSNEEDADDDDDDLPELDLQKSAKDPELFGMKQQPFYQENVNQIQDSQTTNDTLDFSYKLQQQQNSFNNQQQQFPQFFNPLGEAQNNNNSFQQQQEQYQQLQQQQEQQQQPPSQENNLNNLKQLQK